MGKGGQKSVPSLSADTTVEKKEILIDGVFYDVAKMKHPGGSVIGYYSNNGIDATQAFHSFHFRSKKAKKILDVLPSRPADEKALEKNRLPGQKALLEDFNQLTLDFEKEGLFKPSPMHTVYRLTEAFGMYFVGFWLVTNNYPIVGALVLGVAQSRCAFLSHETGHYSLTSNIAVDQFLSILVMTLGLGMSCSWWRNQHNKHHSMPQRLGHDVDLNTLPLVAFTEKIAKRVGVTQKYWVRAQAFLFPFITTSLVTLSWQYILHPRHIMRTKNTGEALALFIRHAIWSYFITYKYGFMQSVLMYLIFNWVTANILFVNFALAHTHLPVVSKDDNSVDWVRYSSEHTMNISPGPFRIVSWHMGYLDNQIEHHLFPAMPQFRNHSIVPRVKALFAKHGLRYQEMNYFDALKVTFANLHNVGADIFYG